LTFAIYSNTHGIDETRDFLTVLYSPDCRRDLRMLSARYLFAEGGIFLD